MSEIRTKHAGGRPLLWTEPKVLADLCDKYFRSITRTKAKTEQVPDGYDEKGKQLYRDDPVLCNDGTPYLETQWLEPPTLSALADYLQVDRKTLINYRDKDEFFRTLRAAKTKIERYLASGLVTVANPKGYEFSLLNNHDWQDRRETVVTGQLQTLPTYDVSRMSLEQKKALYDLLMLASQDPDADIDVPLLPE